MVKTQHYVPRFYLKHFSSKKNKIWVYDKQTKKRFPSSIENVACEGYFYDDAVLDKNKEKSQFLESYYSEIENKVSPFYTNFINSIKESGNHILTTQERQTIADYLVTQIDRTREQREETYQFTTELYNQLKSKGFTEADFKRFGFEEEFYNRKELHIESILAGDEMRDTLSEILFDHIWIIYKNCTSFPFYTSDHPIVKHGHIKDDFISNEGYGSPGIEVAFPLNPCYILIMADREEYSDYEVYDGRIVNLNSVENIKYYNSLQVISSYRQVFSESDNFYMVDEIYKIAPSAFDLKRKRIG